MVNYGAAFKLPFTNLQRSAALFLLAALASLAHATYQIIKLSVVKSAGQGLGTAPVTLLAAIISFMAATIFYAVIFGYSIRIMATAINGKNELPSFGNFTSLITTGLKYLVATLIYFLPLIIAALIIIPAGAFGLSVVVALAILIAVLLWLILLIYLIPVLLANFAHEKRFAALFDLKKSFKYAFTGAYFAPWAAALGYTIALTVPYSIVVGIIGLFSLLTPLALMLTVPIAAIYIVILNPTVNSLYGQAYRDVMVSKHAAVAAAATKGKRVLRKK